MSGGSPQKHLLGESISRGLPSQKGQSGNSQLDKLRLLGGSLLRDTEVVARESFPTAGSRPSSDLIRIGSILHQSHNQIGSFSAKQDIPKLKLNPTQKKKMSSTESFLPAGWPGGELPLAVHKR